MIETFKTLGHESILEIMLEVVKMHTYDSSCVNFCGYTKVCVPHNEVGEVLTLFCVNRF